jgi:signal transduction histidine kinase/CheY-like chemotaxis protein
MPIVNTAPVEVPVQRILALAIATSGIFTILNSFFSHTRLMKKYTLYFILITLIVIILNIYFSVSIYLNQISFQRSILSGQSDASAAEIEKAILKFENEVNALLYSNILLTIDLKSDDMNQDGVRSLEMLFSNNNGLIRNVHIFNRENNVLNLTYNKRKKLLIDPYETQRNIELFTEETREISEKTFKYTYPVFHNKDLVANISFELDLAAFFEYELNRNFHDEAFSQSVIDSNGTTVCSNAFPLVFFTDTLVIRDKILSEESGFVKHRATIEGKKEFMYSAFSPLMVANERFGVIFSMRQSFVFDLVLYKVIIAGVFSTLIMIIFLLLFTNWMGKNLLQKELVHDQLSGLQSIFDNLPVGIMVLDQNKHVKIINQTAKEMLLIGKDDDVSGKNLTDRFMLSRDYYDSGDDASFDNNQFVLYRHEGEEVAVYKKEIPYVVENEEFLLSAFVDVTPIEKARKYEAASNTAKSEFLAKMSHEIRTPMNGIIGMTEALYQENLTQTQKEYVQIVKRSADVLLTLIDDILDFSKIEAGKMQLEEIPFKLREEIKLAVDLFRPIIEEKKLNFSLKINPEVPENIIGDPFRLRQVLSNLISNAVKFTHEGEIAVGVNLEEEYNNNITLLFYVEDTGVGIARNKIETIFNSFTQAEESTSRKYGGSGLGTTIAKQLVTLMHGEIWVQSPSPIALNASYPGSRFSFTIEVYSNEKIIKPLHFEKITQFDQVRTLIISSLQQPFQQLLRIMEFEKIPYDIYEYTNEKFAELKKLLSVNDALYQVIILVDESGSSSLSLARKLKENRLSDQFIIMMISRSHKTENFIQARRFGVDYYFFEPLEQSDIVKSLYEAFPYVQKAPVEIVSKIKSDLSILVAEDNEINVRVAQTIFSNLGYEIEIAKNGTEAINMVKSNAYDIVFMDLVMPEKDGIQATVEIRGEGYQMPIVAMTATASAKSKSKAISSGMNDYMVKPVKMDSIRSILIKWFA